MSKSSTSDSNVNCFYAGAFAFFSARAIPMLIVLLSKHERPSTDSHEPSRPTPANYVLITHLSSAPKAFLIQLRGNRGLFIVFNCRSAGKAFVCCVIVDSRSAGRILSRYVHPNDK